MTTDELRDALHSLPEEEIRRLLFNVAWNFFGEVDDEGEDYIDPDRTPDRPDLKNAVEGLRLDLFGRAHSL